MVRDAAPRLLTMRVLTAGLTTAAFKNYGVNVAAVIRFLAMHGAAVAEKAFVGIGVDAGVVDHEHAGIFESPADKAGEIDLLLPLHSLWYANN